MLEESELYREPLTAKCPARTDGRTDRQTYGQLRFSCSISRKSRSLADRVHSRWRLSATQNTCCSSFTSFFEKYLCRNFSELQSLILHSAAVRQYLIVYDIHVFLPTNFLQSIETQHKLHKFQQIIFLYSITTSVQYRNNN